MIGVSDIITQDALFFFDGKPLELELYTALAERLLSAWPGAEVRVQKTQIGFYDPGLFACVSFAPVRRRAERPERFITVTFGLDAPLEDPRALPVRVRPNRWTHHVILGRVEDIDDRLLGWLAMAHALAAERKSKHA